jgi:hypothetical protein
MAVESADDLASFFDTEEWASSAVYRAGGTGDPVTVSVVPDLGTRRGDFQDVDVVQDGGTFRLRKSEVSAPGNGDTLELDGVTYTVQGEPELDIHGLIWLVQARPSS